MRADTQECGHLTWSSIRGKRAVPSVAQGTFMHAAGFLSFDLEKPKLLAEA